LSVDPLVDQTGQPYVYTGGDPVNAVDPGGQNFTCNNNPLTFLGCVGNAAESTFGAIENLPSSVAAIPGELEALPGQTAAAAEVDWHWFLRNRSTVVSLGAVATCLIPGVELVTCGGAVALAFGSRVEQRRGGTAAYEADAIDFIITAASFGLVGVPTGLAVGEAPETLYRLLGISKSDAQIELSKLTEYLLKVNGVSPELLKTLIDRMEADLNDASCPG
jgi:hypothetical protein